MARTGGAERRAQFIATAQALFFTKGYESTSINDIINAVAVSKGAFYHHFESKAAVLEAIVAQMAAQAVGNLQAIVADDSLTAIPKWRKAVQQSNSWKSARKAEVIEANRLLLLDENSLLRHKIKSEITKAVVAEMSKIIAQGVDEGVFEVPFVRDSAEIMLLTISSLSDTMNELFFNPDAYDDPATIAINKNAAVQTAIERQLGAAPGSLPIVDNETLLAWFAE